MFNFSPEMGQIGYYESGNGYISENHCYEIVDDFTVSMSFGNETVVMDTDIGKFENY